MKTAVIKALAMSLVISGSLGAQVIDFPQKIPVGQESIVTTIVARDTDMSYETPTAMAPVWIHAGSTVKLQAPAWADGASDFQWVHSSRSAVITDKIYEITNASSSDSGLYYCSGKGTDGVYHYSESITLLVGQPNNQTFTAVSSLVKITKDNSLITVGFIVGQKADSGQGNTKSVLVRVLGPALSKYGIKDPLAHPFVKFYDSKGTAIFEVEAQVVVDYSKQQQSVGLDPIAPGTSDIIKVLPFSPGGYSVQVGSNDGGTGEALLEIYELN